MKGHSPDASTIARTSLDVVIVNWNAGSYLERAIDSLRGATELGIGELRVILVDNASTDDSLQLIRPHVLDLLIIKNGHNLGFAAASNQGAAAGIGKYILFMNPDVVVEPMSISAPLSFLEADHDERYAICGLRLRDEIGRITPSCARFPTPQSMIAQSLGLDHLVPSLFPPHILSPSELTRSRSVDQVVGAFLMIRRAVFEALGGFDERFFMYFEELDLSLRAKRAGYESFFLADSEALHYGGGSSGQVPAMRLIYSWRSRGRYAVKHYARWQAALVLGAMLVLEPIARLVHGLMKRSPSEIRATLKATLTVWRDVPSIVRRFPDSAWKA